MVTDIQVFGLKDYVVRFVVCEFLGMVGETHTTFNAFKDKYDAYDGSLLESERVEYQDLIKMENLVWSGELKAFKVWTQRFSRQDVQRRYELERQDAISRVI